MLFNSTASAIVSEFYEREHRSRGVDIRLAAHLDALTGKGGRLGGVLLSTGETSAADLAVVGIGVRPNAELAETAGIACSDGIEVDGDARTSDPDVFAIGDCTRRPLLQYGRSGRLESVHNAVEQAKLAVSAIVGKPRPHCDVPWFWSDQYDLKLQTAGLLAGHDKIVLRGDPAERKFAVYYLKDGRLLAVDAVNSAADFLCGKKLAGTGVQLDKNVLRASEIDIKQFVAEMLGQSSLG